MKEQEKLARSTRGQRALRAQRTACARAPGGAPAQRWGAGSLPGTKPSVLEGEEAAWREAGRQGSEQGRSIFRGGGGWAPTELSTTEL